MKGPVRANGVNRVFLERLALPIIVAIFLGVGGALAHTVMTVQQLQATRFTKSEGEALRKETLQGDREIRESIARLREDLVRLQELKTGVLEMKQEMKHVHDALMGHLAGDVERDALIRELLGTIKKYHGEK